MRTIVLEKYGTKETKAKAEQAGLNPAETFECSMPNEATLENLLDVLGEFVIETNCKDAVEFLNRWCYKHLCDKKRAEAKRGTSGVKEATTLVKQLLAKGLTIDDIRRLLDN